MDMSNVSCLTCARFASAFNTLARVVRLIVNQRHASIDGRRAASPRPAGEGAVPPFALPALLMRGRLGIFGRLDPAAEKIEGNSGRVREGRAATVGMPGTGRRITRERGRA